MRTKNKYHLQEAPIPAGYQIYEERLDTAGIVFRKKAAQAFVKGFRPELTWQREPRNKQDPNAIKLIGISGLFPRRKRHVGYVPADVAARIAQGDWWGRLQLRLLHTYLGKGGFVEIQYQLLGPQGEKKKYGA